MTAKMGTYPYQSMNTGSTLFLRAVVYIIGLVILAILGFGIPLVLVSNEVGGYFPILLGLYIPAVPFFFALFQALKLLNYVDTNTAFSERSVNAIWIIKYCAAVISIFFAAFMPYIFYVAENDDAPGVAAIGLVFTFAPLVIAVFAAVLQQLLQSAIDIKAENDLTV